MSAYEILAARGVTRLCHFTKLRSLTHITASEDGILASGSIRQDTKNVLDTARYDGELEYVCCSFQYPNSWFMEKAVRSNQDEIFKEWLVLYVDPRILNDRAAKFCPCNASREYGRHIQDDMSNIESVFSSSVSTFKYGRSPKMLSCCPTDGQAEVLIQGNIPRNYIIGIAVGDEDIAKRIYAMLKTSGVAQIPLYIAPDVMTKNWSSMIKDGRRPAETPCNWQESEQS